MITLSVIGAELSDLHDTDELDLPLDKICADIRASIHQTYRDNWGESHSIMRGKAYKQDRMQPEPGIKEKSNELE